MGKCVRIRGGSKRNPSPSTGEAGAAAACLTLRSGRRVPVAASSCSPPPGSRRHHRRCGARAKRACGSPGRQKCASEPRPPRCRATALADDAELSGGDRPAEEEELPSSPLASPVARDVDGESAPTTTPLSGDGDELKSKHEHGSSNGVVVPAGQTSPSPLLQAEMEAFFAAAELAERQRFAEAYNYDVALDRPLEGRFEWAPVST